MGPIENFIKVLMDSIIQHRQNQVEKVMRKDPELKRLYSELSKITNDISAHIEKKMGGNVKVADGEKVAKKLFDH